MKLACFSRNIFLMLTLSLFLSGCAASGRSFTEASLNNPKNALVYIYRIHGDKGEIADVPYLYINDKQITAIRKGGYTVVEVPSGPTTINLKFSRMGIPVATGISHDIMAESGKTYFFEMSWLDDYAWTNMGKTYNFSQAFILKPMEDTERALYNLKTYKFQPPK